MFRFFLTGRSRGRGAAVPVSYLMMMFSFQLNKIDRLKKDHYNCVHLILIHKAKTKMKVKCSSIYRSLHSF